MVLTYHYFRILIIIEKQTLLFENSNTQNKSKDHTHSVNNRWKEMNCNLKCKESQKVIMGTNVLK